MTGHQFKAAIERLEITQVQFARANGVGDRTVRTWIATQPPLLVAKYMHALEEMPKRKQRALLDN